MARETEFDEAVRLATAAHAANRAPQRFVYDVIDVMHTLREWRSSSAPGAVRMHRAIHDALNELGVPDENYPAPVANAVNILREAIGQLTVKTNGATKDA